MHAASGERETLISRPAERDNAPVHPAWRRIVAGAMAIVFALTLSLFGLMLCLPFAP